jgi:hypothetical protein
MDVMKTPRFRKEMEVEICPFQHGRICADEDILRLDGRRGTVTNVKNHSQGQIVYVHVEMERAAIAYLTEILKPMVESQR